MKKMRTVVVPEQTVERVECVICDLCKNVIQDPYPERNDVRVEHRFGEYYGGDGAGGDEISFDLCGKCFREKLVPWLQEQGATQTYKEWDC